MSGRLWITGVAGFTGRHLVTRVRSGGDRVQIIGLDVAPAAPSDLDDYHRVDLGDSQAVAALARAAAPDWVIHLAGAMPPAPEADMWKVNVGGTVGLIQALQVAGCRATRLVGVGSAAEYVPSSNRLVETSPCAGGAAYGRTKWVQTLVTLNLAKQAGMPAMVARPFNLIGPGLPPRLVAGSLCQQVARAGAVAEIQIGNTGSARDFVDVRDAADAYWRIARHGQAGEVYNVCTGVPTRVSDLLQLIGEASGKEIRIHVSEARLRQDDLDVSCGDPGKLDRAVGWTSTIPLLQSVRDMLAAEEQAAASAAGQ